MDNDTPKNPDQQTQDDHSALRDAFHRAKEDNKDPLETPATPTNQPTTSEPVKNYRMDHNPVSVDTGPISYDDIENSVVNIHNLTAEEFAKFNEVAPNYKLAEGDQGQKWGRSYLLSSETMLNGNVLTNSLAREDAMWDQKVTHEGERIGAGRPRFGGSQGGVISGERALIKTAAALGLGGMVQIPLWHSGIWVSIKAPSETSLLELYRRIANEKIQFGRTTSGMLFSNSGIYTVSYVTNFALQHVYDSSMRDSSPEYLKGIIKAPDIPILIWGLACAIFTRGYRYARPCTTDPSSCQHVTHGTLDLGKMIFTDSDSLSDWQKRLMVRRNDKFTTEEVEQYQNERLRGANRRIAINDILSIVLKVPTIREYESSGFKWVDGIVNMLEGALGTSLRGDQRENYVREQAKLTALRQYSHWVKEVQVDEDIIEDQDTLEQFIGTLSGSPEITDRFLEEVGTYIDDSVLSVIAIPRYKCDECDGEQKADVHDHFHPYLLPVDVIRVFFTQLRQRLETTISRDRTGI